MSNASVTLYAKCRYAQNIIFYMHIVQYESDKRIGSVSAKNMRLSSVFDYPEETIHNKFYTSKAA